jgi:hypothetical protein
LKRTALLCFVLLGYVTALYCGQASKIELVDGSFISGEVVSFADGVYTINTEAFGELRVGADKIAKIDLVGSSAPGALTPSQAQAFKTKIMANPQSAAIATRLATDPRIQELARDPKILEAAQSGNIQDLMNGK